jgi:hypothetical protein
MAIVKVTIERFDQYKLITSIFAYIGAFTVISFVFTLIFRRYNNSNKRDYVNLSIRNSPQSPDSNSQDNDSDSDNESLPIIRTKFANPNQ